MNFPGSRHPGGPRTPQSHSQFPLHSAWARSPCASCKHCRGDFSLNQSTGLTGNAGCGAKDTFQLMTILSMKITNAEPRPERPSCVPLARTRGLSKHQACFCSLLMTLQRAVPKQEPAPWMAGEREELSFLRKKKPSCPHEPSPEAGESHPKPGSCQAQDSSFLIVRQTNKAIYSPNWAVKPLMLLTGKLLWLPRPIAACY